MSLSEIKKYAWEYRRQAASPARAEIVRTVWKRGRFEGLRMLSIILGVSYSYLYREGDIDKLKKQRNISRRGRSARKGNMNMKDIKSLAMDEAGGGKIMNSGGKRTKWTNSSGRIKSAASGQAWSALSRV